MSKLIVDLSNQNGKLVDSCGNGWIYNGGSDTIPSDCIVNGPKPGTVGFKTSPTNTRYIKLNTKGSLWNQSPMVNYVWTIALKYRFVSNDFTYLYTVSQNSSVTDQVDDEEWEWMACLHQTSNGKIWIYKQDIKPSTPDGVSYYLTHRNEKAITKTSDGNWRELRLIADGTTKVYFYCDGVFCGDTTCRRSPSVNKNYGFYIGTWWYNPTNQTRDLEIYNLKVYEGIEYPDPNDSFRLY